MPRFPLPSPRRRRTRRRAQRRLRQHATRALSRVFSQWVSPLFEDAPLSATGGENLDLFSGSTAASATGLTPVERGVDALFSAGLGLLGAGREKRTRTTSESSRSQALQQQFNFSRGQQAAMLHEAMQRGGRNL